jgi:START domain
VDEHTWVTYDRCKKVSIVSGREFILIFHWEVDAGGAITVAAFSDEREDLVPNNPELVRGGCPIGGWRLEPRPNNVINVTYLTEVDFRGFVPGFLLIGAFKD